MAVETFRAQIPDPEQGRIGDIDIVEEWGMERTAARVHRGYLTAEHVMTRAHLLAAAPELLAALAAAQAAFAPETIEDPTFDPHGAVGRAEAVGLMLAAIAKARGDAP